MNNNNNIIIVKKISINYNSFFMLEAMIFILLLRFAEFASHCNGDTKNHSLIFLVFFRYFVLL